MIPRDPKIKKREKQKKLKKPVPMDDFYDEFEFERILFLDIKTAREKKGVSQRELARKTGLEQSAIARFENGRIINPTLTFLKKILIGLDLELKVCDIIIP